MVDLYSNIKSIYVDMMILIINLIGYIYNNENINEYQQIFNNKFLKVQFDTFHYQTINLMSIMYSHI